MKKFKHDYNCPKKMCSKCKTFFPRTDQFFHKAKKTKDGFSYVCKKCKKIIDRESRKNSPTYKNYSKTPEFVFAQLKYQAKKRKITFELDIFHYLEHLAFKPCFYCGSDNTKHWIDRYQNDHSIGYTKKNSVPCCELCNKMKMHHKPETFIKQCKKIVDFNL